MGVLDFLSDRAGSGRQSDRAQLARIERMLQTLLRASEDERARDVMAQADIDRMKQSVSKLTDAKNGVVAIVQGLAQQIRDSADDPEELKKLADEIDANATDLGQVVVDNTRAANP